MWHWNSELSWSSSLMLQLNYRRIFLILSFTTSYSLLRSYISLSLDRKGNVTKWLTSADWGPLAPGLETAIQVGTSNPLRQKTEDSRCFGLVQNKLVTSCPLPARLVLIGLGSALFIAAGLMLDGLKCHGGPGETEEKMGLRPAIQFPRNSVAGCDSVTMP